MDTLIPSEIFFVISSVGFVILWILAAIVLFYFIRITRTFSKIMKQVEDNVSEISDTTKEILLDMRESAIFQFIFGKKRGRKETKKRL